MPHRWMARVAALILAAESAGLAILAAQEVIAWVSGAVASVANAVALLVLTTVGMLGLAAFAVACWRQLRWGRSGGLVAQLLILAVAGGALTGVYADPTIALWLGIPAVVCIIALLLSTPSERR